jgi:thioredoxin
MCNDNQYEIFLSQVAEHPMVLVYFSTPTCNVCKAIRPKVEVLLKEQFPEVSFRYVNAEAEPEIAGQLSVFAVPTILLFVEGKETFRKSRNFSMDTLANDISRPYSFLF